jgi:23S rRNA pseudouridine2605 synthase
MPERIQKLLAAAGIASRREAEKLIEAGRVSLNGNIIGLGAKAELSDTIRVDGKIIRLDRRPEVKHRVLAYHKPEGEICSRSDPEGRVTIFARLPRLRSGRWIAVGRLDINTSGLILLTTDGELANKLMHPSSEIEREYAVRILGEVDEAMLRRLRKGVELDDGPARFTSIRDAGGQGANHWYHVTLHEGRNREVRRLWESQGVTVSRLARVRFGPVSLRRGSKPGEWDELMRDDINKLRQAVGLPLVEEVIEKAKTGKRPARPRKKAAPRARQAHPKKHK